MAFPNKPVVGTPAAPNTPMVNPIPQKDGSANHPLKDGAPNSPSKTYIPGKPAFGGTKKPAGK